MQPLTVLVLEVKCPYCGAAPGAWCWSPKSGLKARYLHAARGEQVYAAWRIGMYTGKQDALEFAGRTLGFEGRHYDLLRRGDVAAWLIALAGRDG
jgi:hypothetical protein